MNAATCSCRTDRYRTSGSWPAASIRFMIVVPGGPKMCRTPARRRASTAICAPFTYRPFHGRYGRAEQFAEAFLAADAGQLDPAERYPGEMSRRAVDARGA